MKVVPLAAALLLVSGTASAKSLHIQVDEKEGDRVSITVPMGVARAVLSITDSARIELEDEDVSAEELREMWNEIKKSGEKELVRVQSDDEDVKVTRERGEVRIRVREKQGARVDIRMPEDAIDALLSSKGNELDLAAAMREIRDSFEGDLVNVRDGSDTVRIWVE